MAQNLIAVLKQMGPTSISCLAATLDRHRSSISRRVTKLIEKGLIEQVPARPMPLIQAAPSAPDADEAYDIESLPASPPVPSMSSSQSIYHAGQQRALKLVLKALAGPEFETARSLVESIDLRLEHNRVVKRDRRRRIDQRRVDRDRRLKEQTDLLLDMIERGEPVLVPSPARPG